MKIQTISTGSREGNAFLIDDGRTKLLLECGVTIKKIKKALNYRLSSVKGCLITHRHGDHSKGLKGLLDSEVDTYIGELEKEALGINHHRLHGIRPLEQFSIGTWTILPFSVEHDTEQPLGYLLQSTTGVKMLFATDTYYIRYFFKGLTHILIECNYSEKVLDYNLENNIINRRYGLRVMESHLSLENLVKFLKACDLSKLEEIRLIHLSDTNSDEELFRNEIQKVTGIPVYIES